MLHLELVLTTKKGTVGESTHGLSMSAVEATLRGEKSFTDFTPANAKHWYTVTKRDEDDETIVVTVSHQIQPEINE